jgi:hypothetical protein
LSKHITKGKEEVEIEQVLDMLSVKEEGKAVEVDSEW